MHKKRHKSIFPFVNFIFSQYEIWGPGGGGARQNHFHASQSVFRRHGNKHVVSNVLLCVIVTMVFPYITVPRTFSNVMVTTMVTGAPQHVMVIKMFAYRMVTLTFLYITSTNIVPFLMEDVSM